MDGFFSSLGCAPILFDLDVPNVYMLTIPIKQKAATDKQLEPFYASILFAAPCKAGA